MVLVVSLARYRRFHLIRADFEPSRKRRASKTPAKHRAHRTTAVFYSVRSSESKEKCMRNSKNLSPEYRGKEGARRVVYQSTPASVLRALIVVTRNDLDCLVDELERRGTGSEWGKNFIHLQPFAQ